MSQGDTPITMIGNVVAAPELRYTPSGTAVSSFRVASTPRVYSRESGRWEDGEPVFLTCNVWKQLAEHCCAALGKGTRVIVSGRLTQSRWETKDGEKRTAHEIDVQDIGLSIKFGPVGAHPTAPPAGGGFTAPRPRPIRVAAGGEKPCHGSE